jgi:hypothetical protein
MNSVENSVLREGNKLHINLWGKQRTFYSNLLNAQYENKSKLDINTVQVEVWSGDYYRKEFTCGNNENHKIFVKF